MSPEPHFDTQTDSNSRFRNKKIIALAVILTTVLTLVLTWRSFELSNDDSLAYVRLIGTERDQLPIQDQGSLMNTVEAELSPIPMTPLPAGSEKSMERSRKDEDKVATPLQKGELALSVPRLGLRDVKVPDGSTQAKLDGEGIVRLEPSGVPWQEGSNTFIVGHRVGFSQTKIPYVFYELDKMKPRDKIFVEDHSGKKYVFEVYDYMTVPPTHYWLTHPVDGKTVISLQTCTPIPTFKDRLVVRGELISVYPS